VSAVFNMMDLPLLGVACLGAGSQPGVWRFQCDCGALFERRGYRVRTAMKRAGHTSCGSGACRGVGENGKRNRTHGVSVEHRKLYDVHRQMWKRCTDPESPDYAGYGGRGITVCEQWRNVVAFRDWALTSGYAPGLSIDRVDGDKGYCPDNCRWASDTQQVRNRCNTLLLIARGETRAVAERASITGIPYSTIRARVYRGLSGDTALAPVGART
jgi:hypothetical protein